LSVHPILAYIGINWALRIAPFVDTVYNALGRPLLPDPLEKPHHPEEIHLAFAPEAQPHLYTTPVWVFSLWTFTFAWTVGIWFFLNLATYALSKALKGKGGLGQLFLSTGIALVPWVNWWFYVGSETMFELVPQTLYTRMVPPFSEDMISVSVGLGGQPNVMSLEAY